MNVIELESHKIIFSIATAQLGTIELCVHVLGISDSGRDRMGNLFLRNLAYDSCDTDKSE